MAPGLNGADLEGMDRLAALLSRQAQGLTATMAAASADVAAIDRLWAGPDSAAFHHRWIQHHRPALVGAVQAIEGAAGTVTRNRELQDWTSATGAISGGSVVEEVIDFLLGDVANMWNGGSDGFPIGQAIAALARMSRVSPLFGGSELPLFNTGLVGQTLASLLSRGPGPLAQAGAWLGTPAASRFFLRAGIVGGVVSTGAGVYNLYQQGNPIDAFEREGAGYVADVASTAFSASTTAFLVAPNPVTGALVIGTGAVWLGAEVVDNWDAISDFAGDAWDVWTDSLARDWEFVTGVTGDVWNVGTDLAGDLWTGASDAWDTGTDLAGDVLDGAGDMWATGTDLVGGGLSTIGGWLP